MFRKKQSLGLRLWHWSNGLGILLLLITVALRETFLDARDNASLLLSKANTLGVALSENQTVALAKAIRNQMWQWHPIIGFFVIGLLLVRLLVFFADKNKNQRVENSSKHFQIVKKSYLLFYGLLAVMGVTGSLMYWDEVLHISEQTVHSIQEVHEALMWFFIVFILVHIAGVIRAEQGADKGIVSDMINGGENQ